MNRFFSGFEKRAWLGSRKKTEADNNEYLRSHIKAQGLESHLSILNHPKADNENMLMQEIIRRYGKPKGVIRQNPGGGEGDGPYTPVYSDSYWESIGGKASKK